MVLYRDTNAWCPYCQKVWMALLEKGIPFDTVLVSLQNKPAWFSQVNEALLTPVARIKGANIAESNDILMVRRRRARSQASAALVSLRCHCVCHWRRVCAQTRCSLRRLSSASFQTPPA